MARRMDRRRLVTGYFGCIFAGFFVAAGVVHYLTGGAAARLV